VVAVSLKKKTVAEWSAALSSVSSLLGAHAGTEQPWLAEQLSASMPVVAGSGSVENLANQMAQVKKAKSAKATSWSSVTAPIAALVEKARG